MVDELIEKHFGEKANFSYKNTIEVTVLRFYQELYSKDIFDSIKELLGLLKRKLDDAKEFTFPH